MHWQPGPWLHGWGKAPLQREDPLDSISSELDIGNRATEGFTEILDLSPNKGSYLEYTETFDTEKKFTLSPPTSFWSTGYRSVVLL